MDAGYYSSEINIIRDACSLNDICGWYRQGQILWESGNTVETVILLSRKAPDAEIKVRLDMSELDITRAESKATYKEIQEYVQNKYDLHVTNLYIAQVKREFGIIERENYNTGEGKAKVPQVTPEKREAIIDALRYFQMIE